MLSLLIDFIIIRAILIFIGARLPWLTKTLETKTMNVYIVKSVEKTNLTQTEICAKNSFEARKQFAALNDLDIIKDGVIAIRKWA